jgi:hypothetical protein
VGGSGKPDPVGETVDLARSIETATNLVGSRLRIVEFRSG